MAHNFLCPKKCTEIDQEEITSDETNLQKLNHTLETSNKQIVNVTHAEEFLKNSHINLIPYEKQMFLDIIEEDALTVCAKGLRFDRVVLTILKIYSNAANLVLVINCNDWEEEYYKSKLDKKYIHDVASTAAERERAYLEGGIQFISTRILVVDLLKNRIPIQLITGIVVMRAHTIIESCQEAFALRLYRLQNKTGFIKAFSNSAESFTIGFSHIERTMRNLFVKELLIWPRFHPIASASLKPYGREALELLIPLSYKSRLIQSNLLDIMNYLVRELKRINQNVELEEVTVENCITKKFHKILQSQLDCIWHQLNSQTKLIVADLKILRNLMLSIIYNDAVSAYALVKRYRTTEYAFRNSGWTLLDAAEQVFKLAKERVYNRNDEFEPEYCPKWSNLTRILEEEIPADMTTIKLSESPKVLILCQDSRTCFLLKHYLTEGANRYLLYTAMRHEIAVNKLSKPYEQLGNVFDITQKINDSCLQNEKHKSQKLDKKEEEGRSSQQDELMQLLIGNVDDTTPLQEFQENYMLTMTQTESTNDDKELDDESKPINKSVFEPIEELNSLSTAATCQQPFICIQTCKTDREGPTVLDRILEEMRPHYVILYHLNLTALRQLEFYEACLRRPINERIKIFTMFHSDTVEEQSFLTGLRRENEAFDYIMDKKCNMVIPEYQDGKTDEAFILNKQYRDIESLEPQNELTRKAGGQLIQRESSASKIVVDMREFRSDLPCLIHKRGIEVIPMTITVGDYILTPEICVERKSISDLIGSLNSGRLYNQCIQMQRYYIKPILLIEFDQNKPFHLQGRYMLSHNTTATNADIMQKLQLLTLHFPKLRLIWSPSPYATAQMFEELKMGKEEPCATQAAAVGSEETHEEFKFNSNIYDFLLRLPGVNTKNIFKLMRNGGNLKCLLKKTQKELSVLLDGEHNGKLLWDILHVSHLPDKDEVSGTKALLATNKKQHNRFRRGASTSKVAVN